MQMRRSALVLALALCLFAAPAWAQMIVSPPNVVDNLFVLSGGKIDFGAGNVILTHSANTLTLAGGQFLVPLGSASTPSIRFDMSSTSGFWADNTKGVYVVNDSVSYLLINKAGNVPGMSFRSDGGFMWSSENVNLTTTDLFLLRDGGAILQLGVDAASPVAQTLKGPDGAGTDIAGGTQRIGGGRGTGLGPGGPLILASAPAGGATGSCDHDRR